jgi:hypothetical protein
MTSPELRAQLSHRLRYSAPREWSEFIRLWIAFNDSTEASQDADLCNVLITDERRAAVLLRNPTSPS